jgi:hypothetical protein
MDLEMIKGISSEALARLQTGISMKVSLTAPTKSAGQPGRPNWRHIEQNSDPSISHDLNNLSVFQFRTSLQSERITKQSGTESVSERKSLVRNNDIRSMRNVMPCV